MRLRARRLLVRLKTGRGRGSLLEKGDAEEFVERRRRRSLRWRLRPVSYTHLTLPTTLVV